MTGPILYHLRSFHPRIHWRSNRYSRLLAAAIDSTHSTKFFGEWIKHPRNGSQTKILTPKKRCWEKDVKNPPDGLIVCHNYFDFDFTMVESKKWQRTIIRIDLGQEPFSTSCGCFCWAPPFLVDEITPIDLQDQMGLSPRIFTTPEWETRIRMDTYLAMFWVDISWIILPVGVRTVGEHGWNLIKQAKNLNTSIYWWICIYIYIHLYVCLAKY